MANLKTALQPEEKPTANPFDALDDATTAEGLKAGPRPSLYDRFKANEQAGVYQNTLAGIGQSEANMGARKSFDRRYEAMPDWEGFSEGAAALTGQLVGTMESPENFIALGLGARLAGRLGWAGVRGAVLAGAVDAAAINAATDAGIQGYEVKRGLREEFSGSQLAASTALGGVIGGAAPIVAKGFGAAADRLSGGKVDAASAGNPFDALDDVAVAQADAAPAATDAAPADGVVEPASAARSAEMVADPMPVLSPGREMTVNDGAIGDLPAGPLDGLPVKIADDQSGVPANMVAVDTPDGTRAVVGQGLLADVRAEPALAQPDAVVSEGLAIGDRLAEDAGVVQRRQLARQERKVVDAIAGPQQAATARPQTLTEFLAGEGGLRDQAGELSALDLKKQFVPGRGKLVRENGRPLDDARLAAAQAGYFDHLYGTADQAAARSTVADLLDLVDRDIRNRDVFSARDQQAAADRKTVKDVTAARAEIRDTFRQFSDEMADAYDSFGKHLDDDIVIRAVEIMRDEKLDAASAIEQSILEDYNNAADLGVTLERSDGSKYEIPFFDDLEGRSAQRVANDSSSRGSNGRSEGGAPADGAEPTVSGRSAASERTARDETGLTSDGFPTEVGGVLKSQAPGGNLMGAPKRGSGGTTAAPDLPQLTRLNEVGQALADLLDVPAVRRGRLTGGAKVAGQYGLQTGVIRIRKADDFDVLSHEAGHHFEIKYPAFAKLIQRNAAILEPLAYQGADPAVLAREGFAEFFRLWLTNREAAIKAAPKFADEFKRELASLDPSVAKGLDDVTASYRDYLAQPSGQAVQASIVSGKRPGWLQKSADSLKRYGVGQTISDRFSDLYAAFVDNLHPLYSAVRELQDIHFQNTGKMLDLPTSQDSYKLARMSRGSYSAGHMDILYGVHDYRGLNPSSPSLRDGLIEAMGSPNMFSRWDDGRAAEFGAYLWSRRALGEFERFDRGEIPNAPDKLTRGDHEVNVREMEATRPEFVTAADKIHKWGRALWKKKFDAGLITAEQYADGLKIRDYVPGLRDFSGEKAVEKPGSRSQDAKSGFVRRFRGSRRDVINPIDSMITDAYETASAIARNDVVRQLDRLALMAGNGSGAIAERIPAKEMRASMVDPIEAVTAAAKASGLSAPDIVVLRDAIEGAIGDEQAAIFRPAIINEKGEAIAFFRDGGRLQALKLADGKFGRDMYSALTMMGVPEKNWFVTMLAKPAAILRAGITTSLDFIGANIARDYATAVILYGKPVRRATSILGGAADEVMGADIVRRYNIAMGMSGGQDVSALRDTAFNRDMKGLKSKGWIARRLTSLSGVLEIAELSETATRLGLFKSFIDEAKKRGLDDFEATLEASFRARDYIDFDRRGWGLAHLARVVPFLNASVQGLDKSTRHMIVPLAKKMTGAAMTPEEVRGLGAAVKSWAYLTAATVGTMSLHAWNSQHEDYDEISETTRATHWMVKAGDKWAAIPKPFEFALLMNLGEAAFDSVVNHDPIAYDRYMTGVMQVLLPPNILEGNPAISTYFEVKSNSDFFTGRPIVADNLLALQPWLQYTHTTSTLGRQLGKAFDQSPAMIDHLITGHFGSWGRNILALYDHYSDQKNQLGLDDEPILRRFIKDASRGSNSQNMFWDLMSRTTGRMKGVKQTYDALVGLDADAGDDAVSSAPITSEAADFVSGLNEREYAYLNSLLIQAKPKQAAIMKRRHPLRRAEDAVAAISAIRRDMGVDRLRTADGERFPRQVRGVADDILSQLAMAETRNALILTGEPGWAQRKEIPIDGFIRELHAISPELTDVLRLSYKGRRVQPYSEVKAIWPDVKKRLAVEIGEADLKGLGKRGEDYGGDFVDAGLAPLE